MAKHVRTAVLVHGCHLQADLSGKTWEDIVWGYDPNGQMTLGGRAVMGLKVGLDQEAEFLIFSTGASERDGVKEGEFTLKWAKLHSDQVAAALGASEGEVLDFLRLHAELDLESLDTRGECERNLRIASERGIDQVILVSSPWHIERCLAEALATADRLRSDGVRVPDILGTASHGGTEGVVILEPPHRGDRPKHRFGALARRFFRVSEDALESFQDELDQLLMRYGA